jgi:hypothetical protein
MAEPTLETLFEKRFADLEKRREDLLARRAQVEQELHEIEDEYQRVKTAQLALQGKFVPREERARKTRAPSTRAPRGERGKLRETLAELVGQSPDGVTAQAIYQELGATDAKEKRPIDAALNAMKKEGTLLQERRRGPYRLGKKSTDAHA